METFSSDCSSCSLCYGTSFSLYSQGNFGLLSLQPQQLDFTAFSFSSGLSRSNLTVSLKMDSVSLICGCLTETASFSLNRQKPCATVDGFTNKSDNRLKCLKENLSSSFERLHPRFSFMPIQWTSKKTLRASQTLPTLFCIRALLPSGSQISAQTSQPPFIGLLLPRIQYIQTCDWAIPNPVKNMCQWYREISHSPFSTLNVFPRQCKYLPRLPGNPKMVLLTTL